MRKRSGGEPDIRLGVLAIGAVFAAAWFSQWNQTQIFRQLADKKPSPVSEKSDCVAEVYRIGNAQEAFFFGESYFGGERGYDLACARAGYARAVALDPRAYVMTWHQYGRTDFLLGNFHNALFKFGKQQEYFGDALPNVHYMRGLTYGYLALETKNVSDWESAEAEFKRYLELTPLSPWARTDLAWILFSQGKYEEMKPLLEEGLITQPRQPWLLNMYGLALLNTNDPRGARSFFEAALQNANLLTVEAWGLAYPGNDPAWWPLGLKEMKEAIKENLNTAWEEEIEF